MENKTTFKKTVLETVKGMSDRYSSVFLVDLETYSYDIIKTLDPVISIIKDNRQAKEAFSLYARNFVTPDMQRNLIEFADFSTMAERLSDHKALTMDYICTAKGRYWCRCRLMPINNEENKIAMVVITFEDIQTERSKDEKLERQLQYIKGLISGYDYIFFANVKKNTYSLQFHNGEKVNEWPDSIENDEEEFCFSNRFSAFIHNHCHPDHQDIMQCYADVNNISQLLKNTKRHTHRFLFSQDNGEYKWTEFSLIKFANVSEEAEIVAATFVDVDADEREKRAQQAALEDVKSIIRSSEMGVWHIKLVQGKEPQMNVDSKMMELMGLDPKTQMTEEELYKAWFSRVHPDAVASVNASVMKMITEGKRDENTYLWIHPTLGERYVRCGGTAVPILGGHLLSGYHYDVTPHMLAELRQKKITQKAQEANKTKTIYLHNMVHDIRTPLNAIMGFSQLLAMPDGSWTEEEKKEHNQQITNAYNMLNMLIEDVLDVANSEHGNYVMNIAETNVNDVCRNVVRAVEFRRPKDVKLTFTSDVKDTYTIMSDGRRIMQVLANFLTNACKHTWAGSITLHCSTTERPGKLTFSVTDTGEGVPPEMAKVIFRRFKKHNAHVEGSGLGLNICTMLAEKLNGEVMLDTSYTTGARFLFIMNLEQGDVA